MECILITLLNACKNSQRQQFVGKAPGNILVIYILSSEEEKANMEIVF